MVTVASAMLFTALLSRHLGPDGYGRYSFAKSVVAIMLVLVNLGFRTAAIRDVAQRKDLASKYLTNIVSMKLLLAVLVFSGFLVLAGFESYPAETVILVLFVGISAVLDAMIQVAGSIFFAFEKMEYHASTQVVRSLVALGIGTAAILMGFNLVQIAAILILANVLRLVLSFALVSRQDVSVRPQVDVNFSKTLLVASAPFALLVVVNVIYSNVNVVMLGALTDDSMVGWYSAALTIITVLLLAPSAFLNSIYPILARFHASSSESLVQSYSKSFKWGLILQLPMAAGIFLVADAVIALVFGPGFEPAADALRVFSLVIGVSFTNYINGGTMNAIGKEKFFAITSWLEIPLLIGLNLLLIRRLGFLGPALTFAISNWIGFILYSYVCHRWLRAAFPWKTSIRTVLAMLVMGSIVYYSLEQGVNLFAVVLIIGPVVYAGAIYLLGALSSDDIVMIKRVLRPATAQAK